MRGNLASGTKHEKQVLCAALLDTLPRWRAASALMLLLARSSLTLVKMQHYPAISVCDHSGLDDSRKRATLCEMHPRTAVTFQSNPVIPPFPPIHTFNSSFIKLSFANRAGGKQTNPTANAVHVRTVEASFSFLSFCFLACSLSDQ